MGLTADLWVLHDLPSPPLWFTVYPVLLCFLLQRLSILTKHSGRRGIILLTVDSPLSEEAKAGTEGRSLTEKPQRSKEGLLAPRSYPATFLI